MRTRALVVALLVLAAAAGPAIAHGWAVDVDPQVVGDEAVVVRHVSMLDGGYLVIHRVEDGEPGPVLGHRHFADQGEHDDVEVSLDRDAWAAVEGPVELAAVVHTDDRDRKFEWPGDDGIYRPDDPVTRRFAVRPADGHGARVVGLRQETDGGVTLRRVALPAEGFVVLYDDADGERGEVVGVEPLPAGHHENVTVSVAPRFYNEQGSFLDLVAVVHRDDGDGTFEPAADDAVTVGDATVTSQFTAEKTRSTVATLSPTPTPTASSSSTAPLTDTPGSTSPTSTDGAPSSPTTDRAAAEGPGLGPLAALAAVGLLVLGRAIRRR